MLMTMSLGSACGSSCGKWLSFTVFGMVTVFLTPIEVSPSVGCWLIVYQLAKTRVCFQIPKYRMISYKESGITLLDGMLKRGEGGFGHAELVVYFSRFEQEIRIVGGERKSSPQESHRRIFLVEHSVIKRKIAQNHGISWVHAQG